METNKGGGRARLGRLVPLGLIAAGAVAGAVLFGDRLGFEALAENREALIAWRDSNYLLAALTLMAVYIVAVALSIPGAVWLTLGAGFLFGTAAATAMVVVAATIGATAIFMAARTGLGDLLREKAGGWLARLERGVGENAVSFMLTMRLVPAVPFFVANLAPAFLGVPLGTYVWTTALGIVPGTAVYASVGAGLGAVFESGGRPDLSIIFSWPVLGPLLGLAALSALPALVKLVRRPRAATVRGKD
jgi:uncharacterized membrane protein YdjX (TVP38/TMEM64 family)